MTKDEQIETLKSALRWYNNLMQNFTHDGGHRAREALAAVEAPPIDIDAAYNRLCRSTLAGDISAVRRAAQVAHAALPKQEQKMREVQARKAFLQELEPPSRAGGYAFDMSRHCWRGFVDDWFKKEYGL